MNTMTPPPGTVTGGVDTHSDMHVAAALDHLGGVFRTAQSGPPRPATASCCGGCSSSSAERPLLDLTAVEAITAEMPEHFRTLVTVMFWGSLRIGEVVALQRRDVDLEAGTLRVQRQQVELTGKPPLETPPKMASRRTVHLPTQAVDALRRHLAEHPRLPPARLLRPSPGRACGPTTSSRPGRPPAGGPAAQRLGCTTSGTHP